MRVALLVTPLLDRHLNIPHRPPCSGRLGCDLQAFTLPVFVEPLIFGCIALGAGALVTMVWRAARPRPGLIRQQSLPVAGVLFAASALAGYQRTGHLVPAFAVSIGLLVAGGLIRELAGISPVFSMLLAFPGAFVLATETALPDPAWARAFAGAFTVVGTGLIDSLDRRCDEFGLGPLLLAVTTLGLYETVPDPDFALLLLGAAIPLVLFGWPVPFGRLGTSGAAAAAGLLAWAGAVGGRGRLGTVVAGAVCLGLFAVEPPAHLLLRGRRTLLEALASRSWGPVVVCFVQLGLAAACTRMAVGNRSPAEVGEIAGVALLLAVICMLTLSEPRSHLMARLRRTER